MTPPGAPEMTVDDVRVAALHYAANGWAVLPLHSVLRGQCTCGRHDCRSPGKHPRTRNGLNDASTDPQQLEMWWKKSPTTNIGICTGTASGIIVLDVDPRHGGEESLASLILEHCPLPETVQVTTGGGGEHFYFATANNPISSSTGRIAAGIDVKADGGYVVAPPSTHVSGKCYAWVHGHSPTEMNPAELPDWLLKRASGMHGTDRSRSIVESNSDALAALVGAAQRYAARADSASEGERNCAAFRLAGHLASFEADDGERLTESQVCSVMRGWNHRNHPPLSDRELKQVVRSAMRNGVARSPHLVRVKTSASAPASDTSSCSDPTTLYSQPAPEEWSDPQPLHDELPSVYPFDCELLPKPFRPWIRDVAERMQAPPDYPAMAAMVALAATVGRKIGIRPKRFDDWLVVPNLWGLAVGPSSVMKSPSIHEALLPLHQMEIDAQQEFDRDALEFRAAALVADEMRRKARSAIRESVEDQDAALQMARQVVSQGARGPTRRRYIVNDSTIEKLGEILSDNANGVLCFRDELSGFLRSLEKEGHECDRAFYLEAWKGTGRFTYDRIGRGTVDIEAAIVSILGSIQPGPLRAYLRAAVADTEGADGLIQRFQLAVYPDVTTNQCSKYMAFR